MDYGKFTGQLGYRLYQRYKPTRYAIYDAHPGTEGLTEPNL